MTRLFISIIFALIFNFVLGQSCDRTEVFVIKRICEKPKGDDAVFIIYSINPVEGFNLRRDVYLRMAIFMKNLRKVKGYSNAKLVLPPFHHL